ncbi:MAG: hypothetical protein ACI4HM_07290 [Ruminococcus sp.]
MAKVPNKTENKLRIACCVLYIIQVFFLTETYSYVETKGAETATGLSCFSLIYKSIDVGSIDLAIYSIIMAVIPIAGFFIFCFDRTRNIKNVYGVLTSAVAVFLILSTIGGYMAFGAMLAIILYIPIVFLSVMGMFARNLVPQDKNKK